MTADRPVVLAPNGYYLPGYKAGGPIQTLAGLVESLEGEFIFRIVTRDRDLGDPSAYEKISVGAWTEVGAAQVMYLSPNRCGFRAMRRVIAATNHDLLYLNSCFSVPFAIVPLVLRRCRMIPHRPAIIAPRGELAPGALAFKSIRKRIYLTATRLLGLTQNVVWQASGPHEAHDIRRQIGERARIVVASDLSMVRQAGIAPRVEKKPGHLRLLFLSRISRMKNLEGALTILQGASGSIHLSIFGPLEDSEYWSRCQELIGRLPPNVEVGYGGPLHPDVIGTVMGQHDLFFLPTLGEAFGHVILEAMVSGCPVLISDRTQWRGLEAAGVGWDVALDEPKRFRDVIQRCVSMDSVTWREISERAQRYGLEALNSVEAREQNRELFRTVYRGQGVTSQDQRPSGTTR
ncbi:MAG: glycosyltransferase [Candidatus Acidiferrales bacterium]